MLYTADILGSTQSTTALLNTRTIPKGSCCRTFPQLSTPLELTESTTQISLYFHTSPGRLPGPWHLGVSLAGEIHPLPSPVHKEDKTTFTPKDSPTDQNIAKCATDCPQNGQDKVPPAPWHTMVQGYGPRNGDV
jgi:hypothetical protein